MNYTVAEVTSLPPFYYPLLHPISVVNTLVTVLAVWVIVRHSPSSMAVYKWFLLNVALSSFTYDTFMTVVADPIPLFPLIAVCGNSFISSRIKDFGVYGLVSSIPCICGGNPSKPPTNQVAHNILILNLCVSILYAFLYRLAAVCNRVGWFKKKRVLLMMALFQVSYGAPTPSIYLANRPDDATITAYISQARPHSL